MAALSAAVRREVGEDPCGRVSRGDRAAARGSAGGVEFRLCHLLGLDELGRGSGGGELRVRIACSVA